MKSFSLIAILLTLFYSPALAAPPPDEQTPIESLQEDLDLLVGLLRVAQGQYNDAIVRTENMRVIVERAEVANEKTKTIILTAARITSSMQQAIDELEEPVDPPVDPPDPPTGRPGEDLDWHVRAKPTPDAYDWIVENGTAVSQRGLGSITVGPGVGLGNCYRASREAGDPDIVFGIMDNAGEAWVGGQYNKITWPSSKDLTWVGEEKASATFVGMTDTASVSLAFSSHLGRATPTGDVLAFDIGLRGPSDSFVIRASKRSDHVQFDGCWWLGKAGYDYAVDTTYASGIHIDEWGTLVIRRHQWRGETPGSPGIKFREHSVAYLKSGRTSTIIELCDMYGGNRCGFQKRPQWQILDDEVLVPKDAIPTDRLMVRNNHCDNYGDNWEHGAGGAVYTVWVGKGGCYIYDNEAINYRFSALVVSPQSPDFRNFEFLASGNQVDTLYIDGNRFIPGPLTERGCASITAVDYTRLYSSNEFGGRVTLGTQWAYERSPGRDSLTTEIWIPEGGEVPPWDLRTFDQSTDVLRSLTPAEVQSLTTYY